MGERKCIGGFWRYWQHMTVRFLPTQEWSCGGTEVYRRILALLATYDCEIPAYAGMVLWGNGELLADLALLSPPLSPEGCRPGDSCLHRNECCVAGNYRRTIISAGAHAVKIRRLKLTNRCRFFVRQQ